MDIEHKKTALDDDSILYQKRDESFGKKDLSSMSAAKKAGYFKDYYLKTILVVAVVAIAVISLIYTMVFRRQEIHLSVGFLNGAQILDTEGLNQHLRDFYELTKEGDLVEVTDYNLEDYASQMRFSTYSAAKTIDILFCDEATFEQYSALGFFTDLSEYLPQDLYARVEDQIVSSSTVETDNQGNVIKKDPPAPRGIDVTGNALYQEFGGSSEKVILGVVTNSSRADNTIAFIEHLLSFEEAAPAE